MPGAAPVLRLLALAAALAVLALLAQATPSHARGELRAGVGRADVTPPQTGYYLGGWTRADRLARGQHTRLFAKTLVLEGGGRKIALVALELFAIPAGLHEHVTRAVADLGFDERNVLVSVTHTHAGPGGFANYPTYNTAAPSLETAGNLDVNSFVELLDPKPADRQLYTFLVDQIALSIRRAHQDLGPAVAGWGAERIEGLTRNRSLEAHLNDHGVSRAPGQGRPEEDPAGALHTIAPAVDVLRVDKLGERRRVCRGRGERRRCFMRTKRVPVGAWSNFANHGTVTKAEFEAYNGDHHASAHRVFEARVREAGDVPAGQDVVNVYGNAEEGDQSAGLDHTGPAGSDRVGRVEAAAMLRAWRAAGRRLSRRPALDLRWTRVCFCGQPVQGGGNVESQARPGIPFFTGSEEERGPLYEVTRQSFEGARKPDGFDSHGHKIGLPAGEFPPAVPLMVVRVADRLIASMPGEPTKEVGARVKQSLLEAAGRGGIDRVVIAGMANEYLSYLTTPEEYDAQHYEGGSTMYGRLSAPFLRQNLADLAARLVRGEPGPEPYAFDPTHGVEPDGDPYPEGARDGELLEQPAGRVERLGHARVAWQGGPNGHDRPVGAPFVIVERRERGAWRQVDSDLGLAILWRVDATGRHDAFWEVPLGAPAGTYRLVVAATGYRLASRPFAVVDATSVVVREVPSAPGRVAVRLYYPTPVENSDLTDRPDRARGGVVRFLVDGRAVSVRRREGTTFSTAAPAGATVRVPAGGARDRFGNTHAAGVTLR